MYIYTIYIMDCISKYYIIANRFKCQAPWLMELW